MKIANWFKDIIKDDSENDLEDNTVENGHNSTEYLFKTTKEELEKTFGSIAYRYILIFTKFEKYMVEILGKDFYSISKYDIKKFFDNYEGQGFTGQRNKEGKRMKIDPKGVKNSSLNVYYSQLKKCFEMINLIDERVTVNNYFYNKTFKDLIIKKNNDRSSYGHFTDQQVRKILVDHPNPLHRLVCYISCVTGARLNEACKIKIENIKFGKNLIWIDNGKKGANRFVYMSDNLEKAIKEFQRSTFYKRYNDGIHLICSKQGKPYDHETVSGVFRKNLEKLGIPLKDEIGRKLVFHSLRKYVVQFFADHDIDIELREIFLGHKLNDLEFRYSKKKFSKVVQLCKKTHPLNDFEFKIEEEDWRIFNVDLQKTPSKAAYFIFTQRLG